MTLSSEEVREGSALPSGTPADPTAETRARARESVTQPDSIAFQAVTQSARAAFRFTLASIAAAARAGSLADAQPPSLRQAREWHHRCAGHYQAGLIRWPRLAWGYLHLLLVVPPARFCEIGRAHV